MMYQKTAFDAEQKKYNLQYSLLVYLDGAEKYYGVEIQMTDAEGRTETDFVHGLSTKKEEAEDFLHRLWAGTALPVELAALCDDFISERERTAESEMLAAS